MIKLNEAVLKANGALVKSGSNFRVFWSGVINHDGGEYSESDYYILWLNTYDMPDIARLWMKASYSRVLKELQSLVEYPKSAEFGYMKFWHFDPKSEVIPDVAMMNKNK